jgi:cysteine desulfurase
MIYADYNGSAPLLPVVKDYLKKRIESDLFANPNALHSLGNKLLMGIEKSREIIASTLGCWPDQIFFNSGSSEAITTIFHSALDLDNKAKKIIIASPIEHAVVNLALEYYSSNHDYEVKFVNIDSEGLISLSHLKKLITEYETQVALVSIMAANNETGVIQPYQEIAQICHDHKIDYFSDTTQIIGKDQFHFEQSGIDYGVCSGHKIGALPGTGFIIAKDPTKLRPLIFSKYQEKGLRGGTQNYLGIETMALALQDFHQNIKNLNELKIVRLEFEKEIKTSFPTVIIVGSGHERLAGTTLIGYPGIHGQAVQIELESNDIFVTTSAACSDNQPETSDALKSMGIEDHIGRSVVRISLSYHQGGREYSAMARSLKNAYNKLAKIHSY